MAAATRTRAWCIVGLYRPPLEPAEVRWAGGDRKNQALGGDRPRILGLYNIVEPIKNGEFEAAEKLAKLYWSGLTWGWDPGYGKLNVLRVLRLFRRWRQFLEYMLFFYRQLYYYLTLLGYERRHRPEDPVKDWVLSARHVRGWIEWFLLRWAEFMVTFQMWVAKEVWPDDWPEPPPKDRWPVPIPPFLRRPPDWR